MATTTGRRAFDSADGWAGPHWCGIDKWVTATHRPEPEGSDAEAPFLFVDGT